MGVKRRFNIDWYNANQASLYTMRQIDELNVDLKKLASIKPKVNTPRKRITVSNATKEQVLNALHKIRAKSTI